jgi:YHS domain-containing protein
MSRLILSLVAALLAGCSVSPAPLLTIPQGHPGNPESAESPYSPPPNPFKQEVPTATHPGQKEEKQDHSHHDHAQADAPELKKPYPLDVCVVTGEKLGEMGKPVIIQHEGREVRFCCPACIDKFKQDPAKYLKKLDEAEKKSKPAEPKHEHDGGKK